jgi:hypothetical protein
MEEFKPLKDSLKASYDCHDERSDLYAYFIERAHRLLKPHGRFGMIVSNKFLRANYGRPLRSFLQANARIDHIVDFAGLPVFAGATVRTIVLLTAREPQHNRPIAYCPPLPVDRFDALRAGSLDVADAITDTLRTIPATALAQGVWSFGSSHADEILARLRSSTRSLLDYCDNQICMGVKSGLTKAFVIDEPTRKRIIRQNPEAREIIKPLLNGRDVRRYHLEPTAAYLIYTYHGIDIRRYPAVRDHLKSFKARLEQRATDQAWYELQQPQLKFAPYMDGHKIIFPDIATEPRFTLDTHGFYGSNTTYFIPRPDRYLLGLLNSRFAFFYFHRTCAGLEGKNEVYLRFFGQYLADFPVAVIDPKRKSDKQKHGRMVSLVDQMLSLHKSLASAQSPADKQALQRQITATDRQIDRLVYDLYGLTDDEIKIVEEATR